MVLYLYLPCPSVPVLPDPSQRPKTPALSGSLHGSPAPEPLPGDWEDLSRASASVRNRRPSELGEDGGGAKGRPTSGGTGGKIRGVWSLLVRRSATWLATPGLGPDQERRSNRETPMFFSPRNRFTSFLLFDIPDECLFVVIPITTRTPVLVLDGWMWMEKEGALEGQLSSIRKRMDHILIEC